MDNRRGTTIYAGKLSVKVAEDRPRITKLENSEVRMSFEGISLSVQDQD